MFLFMFIYNAGVWIFHMCAGTCRGQKKVWDLLELEVTVNCSDGCWELNTGPPKHGGTQALSHGFSRSITPTTDESFTLTSPFLAILSDSPFV